MGLKRLALILVLLAALAGGADAPAGGIADQPCPNVAGEHTNTCPPGKVGAPYSVKFVETEGSGCGPGRQTFHLDSGELPPDLVLAPDGTLNGTPTRAGTFRFYVEMREPGDDPQHCAGKRTQKQFTLTICSRLAVVPSPNVTPRAEVGDRFRLTLSFCGGMGAVTWTVSAGDLPPGLTLRPDGTVTGIPRVAGTFRFTATATDVLLRAAHYGGRITVAQALRVRTRRLPEARVGRSYKVSLAVVGGVAPTTWRITRGGLPRGMRLDPARGVLTGTPLTPGKRRITLEVRDELGVKTTATLVLVIVDAPTAKGDPAGQ